MEHQEVKTNNVPARERVFAHILKLEAKLENSRGPSPYPGNPYWCCKECGIYDPEVSIRNGKHYGNCQAAGLPKAIAHYRNLLETV